MIRATIALVLLLGAVPAAGQSARVLAPNEPLRSAPAATVLATLAQGTALRVGEPRGGWREATLEGWVALASVRGDAAGLVVNAPGGEDLRNGPGGAYAAHFPPGVFLERIEAQGPWVHVRRTGWVRERGVRLDAPAPATPGASPAPVPSAAGVPSAGGPAARVAVRATSALPAAPALPSTRVGDAGAALLDRPGGDTLARVAPFGPVEVVSRQGAWTRVRLEAWLPSAALGSTADSAGAIGDLSAAALMETPDIYRGRALDWSVQFIALRSAEEIRTDFHPGEAFLLTRGPGRESGFVYIAVPPPLLPAARRLQPLQRIRVLARVRNGRSPLMGAPVLDLVELH